VVQRRQKKNPLARPNFTANERVKKAQRDAELRGQKLSFKPNWISRAAPAEVMIP
jgi:hypothetical protein